MSFEGKDRRAIGVSMEDLYNEIQKLNSKVEQHIVESEAMRPRLLELLVILEQSRGVIKFLKFLVYIAAPITAVIYWIKDHVKL